MAKGSVAKELVAKKIQEAFGPAWIGEYDKKYYVWSEENGEKMQIAIAMTCPKVPVGTINQSPVMDFENPTEMKAAPTVFEPAEFTDQERKTVEELMKELGL